MTEPNTACLDNPSVFAGMEGARWPKIVKLIPNETLDERRPMKCTRCLSDGGYDHIKHVKLANSIDTELCESCRFELEEFENRDEIAEIIVSSSATVNALKLAVQARPDEDLIRRYVGAQLEHWSQMRTWQNELFAWYREGQRRAAKAEAAKKKEAESAAE